MLLLNNFWGTLLTLSASSLALLFGMIYLIRPRFMDYHRKALQKDWDELQQETQTLILGLMRVVSGGLLSVAAALIILQIEFNRTRHGWIPLTILVTGGVYILLSLYGMLMVRTRTRGRPPILAVLFIFILLLTGFVFNTLGK